MSAARVGRFLAGIFMAAVCAGLGVMLTAMGVEGWHGPFAYEIGIVLEITVADVFCGIGVFFGLLVAVMKD